MQLNLNDAQLQSAIAGAIIGTLTPETKEKLLTEAVAKLLEPQKDTGYGSNRKTTPLQDAFTYQVQAVAQEVVTEELKTNTVVREKIRGLFVAAMDKVLDPGRVDALTNQLADNFVNFITATPK